MDEQSTIFILTFPEKIILKLARKIITQILHASQNLETNKKLVGIKLDNLEYNIDKRKLADARIILIFLEQTLQFEIK